MAKNSGLKVLWLWVVAAFVLLVGAWVTLIAVASDNAPESIPLVGEG